jgi:hypothetical protein
MVALRRLRELAGAKNTEVFAVNGTDKTVKMANDAVDTGADAIALVRGMGLLQAGVESTIDRLHCS